jgi:hypothetical protein
MTMELKIVPPVTVDVKHVSHPALIVLVAIILNLEHYPGILVYA